MAALTGGAPEEKEEESPLQKQAKAGDKHGFPEGDPEQPSMIGHAVLEGQQPECRQRHEVMGAPDVVSALKLLTFIALWYFFNIQYNLDNKRLLQALPATWAVSLCQLASGIPIALLLWAFRVVHMPRSCSLSDLKNMSGIALCFAVGHVATVASLSSVAVSFTHVVKALEPAINAVASALCLQVLFHPLVYINLVPIVIGVALASLHERSFTFHGFAMAMLSNVAYALRNVLATKFSTMGDLGESKLERNTNQLAVLTIMATAMMLPVACVMPGGLTDLPHIWAEATAKTVTRAELLLLMCSSGFYFFMYQLASFWVLSRALPITHSILNTAKRLVVILSSVLVFRNSITPQAMAGTVLALLGILLYSAAKWKFGPKA